MQLFLVRHGESEGNRDKMFTGHGAYGITDLGRAQAEAVGRALSDPLPTAVYSSDLPRAVQTAAPLVARTGLPLIQQASLRERDMGDYVGKTFAQIQAEYPAGWKALVERDPAYTPPGGESHEALAARVGEALDALRARHPDGRVVVVSHGVAIHHMLRYLLGVPSHGIVFQVDNGSIQRIEWKPDGVVRVAALNDTRHL